MTSYPYILVMPALDDEVLCGLCSPWWWLVRPPPGEHPWCASRRACLSAWWELRSAHSFFSDYSDVTSDALRGPGYSPAGSGPSSGAPRGGAGRRSGSPRVHHKASTAWRLSLRCELIGGISWICACWPCPVHAQSLVRCGTTRRRL